MLIIKYQFSHESIVFESPTSGNMKVISANDFFFVPTYLGSGHSFFTQISPGFSALYVDQTFTEDIKFVKKASSNEFLIFEFNLLQDSNDSNDTPFFFKINSRQYIRMFLKETRIYSLFLFIDIVRTSKEISNDFVVAKLRAFFYNRLLGNENFIEVLRNDFKERSIFNFSFNLYITGISLKIYSVLLTAYSENFEEEKNDFDTELIVKSKDYLASHLNEKFPTLTFLANMSGFSVSKYRFLFKKIYNVTPYEFFVNSKFNLAHEFLKSGTFVSISEVAEALNYNKVYHFYSKYHKHHGRTVFQDFVPKRE